MQSKLAAKCLLGVLLLHWLVSPCLGLSCDPRAEFPNARIGVELEPELRGFALSLQKQRYELQTRKEFDDHELIALGRIEQLSAYHRFDWYEAAQAKIQVIRYFRIPKNPDPGGAYYVSVGKDRHVGDQILFFAMREPQTDYASRHANEQSFFWPENWAETLWNSVYLCRNLSFIRESQESKILMPILEKIPLSSDMHARLRFFMLFESPKNSLKIVLERQDDPSSLTSLLLSYGKSNEVTVNPGRYRVHWPKVNGLDLRCGALINAEVIDNPSCEVELHGGTEAVAFGDYRAR